MITDPTGQNSAQVDATGHLQVGGTVNVGNTPSVNVANSPTVKSLDTTDVIASVETTVNAGFSSYVVQDQDVSAYGDVRLYLDNLSAPAGSFEIKVWTTIGGRQYVIDDFTNSGNAFDTRLYHVPGPDLTVLWFNLTNSSALLRASLIGRPN